MRAITIAAAGLLIGLAGCDQTPATQQQTAQAAPPAAAPCNCGQTAVPDNHLNRLSYVPRHTYRRHHRYDGYHGSHTSRSEEAVQSYGYVSASRVSYSESSQSTSDDGGYAREGYERGGHHYYRGGVRWVDGYGRGYFAGQRPTVAQGMTGNRMDVGHGYDVDCPEGYDQDGY
jgi:hypothetical protein